MENSSKLQKNILVLNLMSLSGWEAPPEHAMNTYGEGMYSSTHT